MRLIDEGDVLLVIQDQQNLDEYYHPKGKRERKLIYKAIKDRVGEIPSIKENDFAHIVRCKDCASWEQDGITTSGHCHVVSFGEWNQSKDYPSTLDVMARFKCHEDFFCAYGRRKEDETH